MLICYSPEQSLRHTNPTKSIRQLLFACIFVFSALPAFAQENPASPEIDILLQQRNELIAQSSDTRTVDRELYLLGFRPRAVIARQILENGVIRISFPAYQTISEERKERVVQRLTAYYSFLLSMDINTTEQSVAFQLPAGSSAAEINSIVEHFGYLGHEEH